MASKKKEKSEKPEKTEKIEKNQQPDEISLEHENQLIQERLKKINELEGKTINPYPYSFGQKNHAADILKDFSDLEAEQKTETRVSVAGRIMTFRKMGKAAFMHIQDQTGKIQLYFRENDLGADKYSITKLLDIGDYIGVKGKIFATKTGEITVYVDDFNLLCKSLRPLPEKYHGLKDTEIKYRQRYLDLIMNEDSRKVFMQRAKIMIELRYLLAKKGFLEMETPTLQPIYGGANAKPFVTKHNALDMTMYLRISPELYLKRLLVGGFEKVYEICKNFRNEGIDTTHNPEFTMVEIYQAYADYNNMMELCEYLYESIAKNVFGTTKFSYKGELIDVKAPWERITMIEAIKKHADIDVEKLDFNELKELVNGYNLEIEGDLTRGKIILALFEELVEDKLIQPVFVIDHPKESTPLCKLHRKNPELIERFEAFIAGNEVCNAYSELNDPAEQKKLLQQQANELRAGSEEAHPYDEDYINALEYGMPPAGGIGIGIDRMVMLFTGKDCIRDVILFPTMKPEKQ